ncbi:hypothetical protein [Streptomyces sp. NPDC056227]|uniref:hypothetical protein n=1 Tax=Streptomyces sp. NPDC056227 TaxID=3345753 RepID=UPI0035DD5207
MTDDELFDAVLARVRTGRPTDEPAEVTVPEPASLGAVEEVERVVGYPMPPLVRRLYPSMRMPNRRLGRQPATRTSDHEPREMGLNAL